MQLKRLKNNFITLFDFFLPRLCISCKINLLPTENVLCKTCTSQLTFAPDSLIKTEYNRKFKKNQLINDFIPLYIFQENSVIQDVIHSLKYEHRYQIGNYLGNLIAHHKKEKILLWKPDLVIPIPLHKLKQAERGFNQAARISSGVGETLKIKVDNGIVKRKRFTRTQTKLTLKEREKNIQNAFEIVKKEVVKNKNVILIDDVITTGATVSECARVLLENGANNVYALSVAIAE